MLKKIIMIVILLITIFLIGCAKQECPDCICPEIPECPACALDCSTCPTVTETKEVISYKYVCENESVVDTADGCKKHITPVKFTPITTNEEGTAILNVTVKPACVGIIGGQVHFKVKSAPSSILFQVKESGEDYRDVYTISPGLLEEYKLFSICAACDKGDFFLKPDKVYLFRMKFDQTKLYNRIEYSNEHIIDTTSGSDYMVNVCVS